jgi:hypothetical protein
VGRKPNTSFPAFSPPSAADSRRSILQNHRSGRTLPNGVNATPEVCSLYVPKFGVGSDRQPPYTTTAMNDRRV